MEDNMSHSRRAFTLIELLVVIAIIAILAAILFPVFAQAKAMAKQAGCISNSKQYDLAVIMYATDTDDYAPLVQWTNSYNANPASPTRDQAVGNLCQPYIKSYPMFMSPASPILDADRDADLINPAPLAQPWKQAQYEFNREIKADYGYNVEYFSPMGYDPTYPNQFHPAGEPLSLPVAPANTLLFVNSVWDRTAAGTPRGGGNWGVDMPCRYYTDGSDSLPPYPPGSAGRWWWGGWNPASPNAWNVWGGVWPYHRQGQIAIVSFADGHAHALRIPQISDGCDVQAGWGGYIFDKDKYIWDLK
jgi:prepilin-type N-terminal cleavage/methylation domain-containing protein